MTSRCSMTPYVGCEPTSVASVMALQSKKSAMIARPLMDILFGFTVHMRTVSVAQPFIEPAAAFPGATRSRKADKPSGRSPNPWAQIRATASAT